jgi:ferric-dicitrate binding protein FerR (iron transport regulator)
VQLAPESKLIVTTGFGAATRAVALTGEAYFDVTVTSGTPFIVRTGSVSTRVLGTAFTVQRYAAHDPAQVVVISGKVVVSGRGTPMTVSAGHAARMTDSTAMATTAGDLHAYTDWTRGQLVFDRAAVPVMLETIGRWYGYEFRLADSTLAGRRVSAAFKIADRSDMMLKLKDLLDVSMRFDSTVVTLTPRGAYNPSRVPVRARDRSFPTMEVGR